MQKRIVSLIVGCLALIGIAVIAVNIGWNLGGISACGSAKETASVASDGEAVLVIGVSDCGRSKKQVIGVSDCGRSKKQTMARILASTGKTYLVFLGSAESADPILTSRWLSPRQLQLNYSPAAQVEFPPENLEGVNLFGDVEVKYKQQ